jgi:hypothetical protein
VEQEEWQRDTEGELVGVFSNRVVELQVLQQLYPVDDEHDVVSRRRKHRVEHD